MVAAPSWRPTRFQGSRPLPHLAAPAAKVRPVTVALVTPRQGPAGMFGPSCDAAAEVAVREINAEGGLLGREVAVLPVDGGAPPREVADEVGRLVGTGQVHAVVGWHISAVRQELAPRIAGVVPYVYTALYEGGEHTPGVYCTGEVPAAQLGPGMRWLRDHANARRWCIVGDDYIWPRGSAAAARRWARRLGVDVVAETYVPLGCQDFRPVVEQVATSGADSVLMLLVGADSVLFNREFAAAGLDAAMVRFSSLLDENMLLAIGAHATEAMYAAAGYFESLVTPDALDFAGRYTAVHGITAPLPTSMGESCYEGLRLLATLVRQARSLRPELLLAASPGAGYDGPRGPVHLRRNHLVQDVYLARVDGVEFSVLERL